MPSGYSLCHRHRAPLILAITVTKAAVWTVATPADRLGGGLGIYRPVGSETREVISTQGRCVAVGLPFCRWRVYNAAEKVE